MMKRRTCPVCGKDFETNHARMKYCSPECAHEQRKKNHRKSFYKHHDANLARMRIWQRKRRGKEITPDVYDLDHTKRCAWCGKEYKPLPRGTGWAKYCSASCREDSHYYKTPENKRNAMLRRLVAAIEREKKIKEKEQRRIDWERHCAEELAKDKTCVICGAIYHNESDASKYCSDGCRKKAENRRRENDKRLNATNTVDTDITLQKLYKRDNGTCYICGGACNWDDWNEEKNYPGDTYPTIEHVIPLAVGGLHSWENVRLAHWKCNVQKGTNIDKGMKPARRVKMVDRAKYTAQYTKTGLFIAVYPSSRIAAERTGIKVKGIQNACRGECKSYGGYQWKYI